MGLKSKPFFTLPKYEANINMMNVHPLLVTEKNVQIAYQIAPLLNHPIILIYSSSQIASKHCDTGSVAEIGSLVLLYAPTVYCHHLLQFSPRLTNEHRVNLQYRTHLVGSLGEWSRIIVLQDRSLYHIPLPQFNVV